MWKWEAEGQPKAVVVIVHNAYEHHLRYAWLIQKLRTGGFHVVTSDLPGHGSENGRRIHDESFDLYVSHVKKMVEIGLQDSLPVFVLGHGLGATLLMHILQREKLECAGFIFSSPWLSIKHQPSKFSGVLSKLSSSMKVNHDITIELLTRNYDMYIEFQNDRYYSSKVVASWYRELQAMMKSIITREESIADVPILVHTGEQDKITDIAVAKKWLVNQQLSDFQYKEWKRLYHDLYQEPEREEVYLFIESFMNNVLRSLGYIV
ncbi:alpha/beta fold hydrolase [Sporosarcina highlanderae]|uniref:Alpha/beta hydrolase n=1 Tax=Sporosarcina highlanderae TaxID=3035916 RepID=A0ABT8JUF6_9BACL|nr:alpha/beta hydrolase [Sporosarcina highlanderae]MDN4607814.1 alpha/beta hydrolase [Sporosarcina highlanderae]